MAHTPTYMERVLGKSVFTVWRYKKKNTIRDGNIIVFTSVFRVACIQAPAREKGTRMDPQRAAVFIGVYFIRPLAGR